MKIGFIGFGEASSNIAIGMLSESTDCFLTYDVDQVRAVSLIDTLGLRERVQFINTLAELLALGDVFFVAVPGKFDGALFESIVSLAPKRKLFVDLCTALPNVKRAIETKVIETDCMYVDVAVMGSVPELKHKVPMYISGSGSDKMLKCLYSYHFDLTKVGDNAGEASVIKICRSIYMKGLAALSIEMTNVSEHYGVKDKVYDSLAKSLDNDTFKNYTPRLINGTIKHRDRRLQEARECLEVLKKANMSGDMTQGTILLYEHLI